MPENTRKDLLDLLSRCNPRTRKTIMRAIEGKAGADRLAFVQEQMNFLEQDGTVRAVDFISSRTCDFGHLQDQQTRLAGVCEVCSAITCSTPGCALTCVRCGRALCRRHASVYQDGEVYCRQCRPFKWLRMFFCVDTGQRAKKEGR